MSDKSAMLEWLRQRKLRITATDVASIMQLEGAYGTPMGVYLDKVDPYIDEEQDIPEHMKWGQRLQAPILAGYAEQTGREVDQNDPYALTTIEEYPILAASLDAEEREGQRSPVEAKNVAFKGPEWGEEGTDQIPQRFYTQVTAQMMVTRTDRAYVAVLFGGRKLAVYAVEFDREVAAGINDTATRFWKEHVLADVPPPVDGGEDWTRYLGRRKQHNDLILQADAGLDKLGILLGQTREEMAAVAEKYEIQKNTLLALMDSNAGIKGTGWSATYRKTKDQTKVDLPGLIADVTQNMTPEGKAHLFQRFTSTTPGYRVFRYHKKEAK